MGHYHYSLSSQQNWKVKGQYYSWTLTYNRRRMAGQPWHLCSQKSSTHRSLFPLYIPSLRACEAKIIGRLFHRSLWRILTWVRKENTEYKAQSSECQWLPPNLSSIMQQLPQRRISRKNRTGHSQLSSLSPVLQGPVKKWGDCAGAGVSTPLLMWISTNWQNHLMTGIQADGAQRCLQSRTTAKISHCALNMPGGMTAHSLEWYSGCGSS